MKVNNQKGMSLFEVLAAVSLSLIIFIVAYQGFYFITNSIDHSSAMTEIRKEANILIMDLDDALINVDSIEVAAGQSSDSFTKFTGVIKKLDASNDLSYINEQVAIEIKDGDLLIDGTKVNADDMKVTNTYFSLDLFKLKVTLEIEKQDSDEKYKLTKFYKLGNE
ncbi:hypothetical protein LCL89_00855 [Halobacillus yeomjeoni]|uniref:PulJ/GspJ family protein n=1 Tax=Halobacillus yeomjeoni TaxID=311194 RepID=UPI001CD47FE0|nr:hypothetical protein [Halobacillus yeomjeoni]MCA0982590.1 hypothetical protein [Halobacillus yeomjeoni]